MLQKTLWIFFSFHGRLDRRHYLAAWIAIWLYEIPLALALGYSLTLFQAGVLDTVRLVTACAITAGLPSLAVNFKRLHDIGYSGVLLFPHAAVLLMLVAALVDPLDVLIQLSSLVYYTGKSVIPEDMLIISSGIFGMTWIVWVALLIVPGTNGRKRPA